jgi:hypothetical protein
MPAGVMAWITLALVSIGYPLWTLLWSRARIVALVRSAMARELRLAPAHFTEATKRSTASKAVTLAVWQKLREADTAAVRAGLHARPASAWLVYFCCGQERLVRWVKPAETASTGRAPRASQAALVSAVRGVSRRDQLDDTPTKEVAPPRPSLATHNGKFPSLVDPTSGSRKYRTSDVGKAFSRSPATGAAAAGLLLLEACNTCADVVHDAPLRPFVGSTFRASVSYAQQVDAVAMSVLAAIQWFWQRPADTGEVAGRACFYVLILVATAWVIGTRNPFWPHDAWKLYVKVGSLLLAALAAVLTHFSLSITLAYGAPPDTSQPGYATAADTRAGLAYAVFVGCILLALVLVLGFWAHTVTGARRETTESKEAARARSSFVVAAAGATGLQLQPQGLAGSVNDAVQGNARTGRHGRRSVVQPRGSLGGLSRVALNPLGVTPIAGGDADSAGRPRVGVGWSGGGGGFRVLLRRDVTEAGEDGSPDSAEPVQHKRSAAEAAIRRGSRLSLTSGAGSMGGVGRGKATLHFAPMKTGGSSRLAGSAAAAAAAGSAGAHRVADLKRGLSRRVVPNSSSSSRTFGPADGGTPRSGRGSCAGSSGIDGSAAERGPGEVSAPRGSSNAGGSVTGLSPLIPHGSRLVDSHQRPHSAANLLHRRTSVTARPPPAPVRLSMAADSPLASISRR